MIIVINIVKRMNKNAGLVIDLMENVYALTIDVKNKTVNNSIKILVLIVTGKIIEIVVDNKIVTILEILKIMNNYISINEILMVMELWVMWIMDSICIKSGNLSLTNITLGYVVSIDLIWIVYNWRKTAGARNSISVLKYVVSLHNMQFDRLRSSLPLYYWSKSVELLLKKRSSIFYVPKKRKFNPTFAL